MKRTEIKFLFDNYDSGRFDNTEITVCGWLKSIRVSKGIAFLALSDGSTFKTVQIIAEENRIPQEMYGEVSKLNTGAALSVKGSLILTPSAKQPFEINAVSIEIEGLSSPDYPLQKKAHSLEYLRTISHLRMRTNTFQAVFKIRSAAAQALHKFFHDNGFTYAHTPIITSNDCEGAGEMFHVTSLDMGGILFCDDGNVDFSQDFFGQHASLTVSGQLEGECMAMAFGKIYTFGPTFRAEKSYTARHAAEFWMIEPEIAFADLDDDMELAESMLKYVLNVLLSECGDELKFCNDFYDKGLLDRIQAVVSSEFVRCPYTKAVSILEGAGVEFEFPVFWGCDLQTEHERYLTETVFKSPVFVTDYPKEIKAFYMRMNDDNKTVAAVDLLVPGVGELIGGSQREERLDLLCKRMEEMGLPIDEYDWYLDLRKYGGAKHAGFGLGFERLIMYVTGISNIRDVIPFPRTTGAIY